MALITHYARTRGGSTLSELSRVRIAYRDGNSLHFKAKNIGFRIVRAKALPKVQIMPETLDTQEIQGTIEPKARPCPHYYLLPPVTEIGRLAETLTYHAGTALCYIWRAGKKLNSDPVEDISKAIDHLCMERDRLKNISTHLRVRIV